MIYNQLKGANKMINEEIDTWATEHIICPYCGFKDIDDYEEYNNEKIYCTECGRYFKCDSELSIHYTTQKIDWVAEWRNYNRNKVSWARLRELDI